MPPFLPSTRPDYSLAPLLVYRFGCRVAVQDWPPGRSKR